MDTFQPENVIGNVQDIFYLGKPLRYLINHILISVNQGHIIINLIDYLPLLKSPLI